MARAFCVWSVQHQRLEGRKLACVMSYGACSQLHSMSTLCMTCRDARMRCRRLQHRWRSQARALPRRQTAAQRPRRQRWRSTKRCWARCSASWRPRKWSCSSRWRRRRSSAPRMLGWPPLIPDACPAAGQSITAVGWLCCSRTAPLTACVLMFNVHSRLAGLSMCTGSVRRLHEC